MIPAAKSAWFTRWFSHVARSRIRATFDHVHFRGVDRFRSAASKPVLLVSNHTCFWDPLVAVWSTNRVAKTDSYALMDGKNLRRLPFFRKVGAFGVDLDEPRDGGLAIRYAARLLQRAGTLVWVFPQGDERPITERPLAFRKGAAAIARLSPDAVVLPMALRYEFGERERPVLHISVGEPLPHHRDVDAGQAAQEQAVADLLDELDELIREAYVPPSTEVFYQHTPSAFSRWMEAWLVRFTRGNTPRET